MRVLLTLELGLNLGNLSRLLPVAQELSCDGVNLRSVAR